MPDVSAGETLSELLPVEVRKEPCTFEQPPSNLRSDSFLLQGSGGADWERLTKELRELEKTLSQLFKGAKDEERPPGYWSGLVQKVNRIFFVCYVTTVAVFLAVIFSKWLESDS